MMDVRYKQYMTLSFLELDHGHFPILLAPFFKLIPIWLVPDGILKLIPLSLAVLHGIVLHNPPKHLRRVLILILRQEWRLRGGFDQPFGNIFDVKRMELEVVDEELLVGFDVAQGENAD